MIIVSASARDRPCARPSRSARRERAGEILDRLDAVLAERDQHGGGQAGTISFRLVLDAERLALGVLLGLELVEIFARAGLDSFASPRRSPRSRRGLDVDIGDSST
jgi:hypothetical protein